MLRNATGYPDVPRYVYRNVDNTLGDTAERHAPHEPHQCTTLEFVTDPWLRKPDQNIKFASLFLHLRAKPAWVRFGYSYHDKFLTTMSESHCYLAKRFVLYA